MNPEDQPQSNRQQGDEQGLTRRRILQVLGTAAAAATLEASCAIAVPWPPPP